MKLDENLFEDVDQISIKDKLEYLKNYPTYNNQYTRPCKVWDLGLTDEQQEKFFTWLEDEQLSNFWMDNDELSQDIYQDGRMGGHLVLSQEVLNPKDFIDVTSYNELLDEYLDSNYYPDNDDGTYTDRQKQEAKEEVDSLINDAYDKLFDFDNRVDQLIENLKMELDGYVTDRESNDIVENLNESIEEVKSILQPLVTKDGKVRALRDDEKLPSGFRFKSGTGTSGEVTYKGTDYAYAVVNDKLKVITSTEAGDNWSETIYKEDLDHEYKVFTIKLKDKDGNIYTEEEKIPVYVLSANPDLDLKEYLKEYYDDEILEVTPSGYEKNESLDNIQTAVDKIFSSGDEGYPYAMLDRMKSDCEYYLGYSNRSSKYLWAKDPKRHIEIMKAIYNRLNPKPEWLTIDQINEYEKQMLNSDLIEAISNDVDKLLDKAYNGSYYTITGAGGDLEEWKNGYQELLNKEGIGTIKEWITFTGSDMNTKYNLTGDNAYPNDLTFLAFPLDGLDIGKLAIFKIRMQDRWFDDIVDNNRRFQESYIPRKGQNIKEDFVNKAFKEKFISESFEDEHLGGTAATESIPETPTPGPESGIAAELNKLIIDEWEAIQGYNDAIVTAELEGYSDIASILRDIANEENVHVGQLQKALQTISPNAASIQTGEQEAQEQIAKAE